MNECHVMAKRVVPMAPEAPAPGEQPGFPRGLSRRPGTIVARFPGPALIADAGGGIGAANDRASDLAAALQSGPTPELGEAIAAVARSREAANERIAIPGAEGPQVLDLVFLSLGAEDERAKVLVLGRDATVEHNLINALIASRQLFKDVVGCTSDFAWETREDGTFGFVSPRGALGYQAHQLDRQHPRTFLDRDHEPPEVLPFEAQSKMIDEEVWLRRADGSAACVLTSCVPVFSETGRWLGARGLCRDVTETRARDAALAQLQTRDMLMGKMVDSIRNEFDPKRMLGVAADSTAQSLDARFCWILRVDHGGELKLEVSHEGSTGAPPEAAVDAAVAAIEADDDSAVFDLDVGELKILVARARYHAHQNGAICLARGRADHPWEADDRALLAGVGNHLGIAIAQIADHEALERLSRTDELTGLVNRRAFYDVVASRFNHLRRMGRHGALLYIDLDNFKPVNDVHGHAQGDLVLKELARLLTESSRAGDIPARFGGDEFVLWLEETDEISAISKAEALLSASAGLRPFSGAADRPLGISIGIAISHPAAVGLDLKALIASADQAMYQAKRAGKGGYVLVAESDTAPADSTEKVEKPQ